MPQPTDVKSGESILIAAHPAIAALPQRWRWGLHIAWLLIAFTPFLMQRYSGQTLGYLAAGLWIGAWIGGLLTLRKAGLVRIPFIVALVAICALVVVA